MFMQSTIDVASDQTAAFNELMAEIVAHQATHGWRLVAAFVQITGDLGTYVDVWEMDDAAHFERGLAALRSHPDFARFRKVLSSAVRHETVVLGLPAPYSAGPRAAR